MAAILKGAALNPFLPDAASRSIGVYLYIKLPHTKLVSQKTRVVIYTREENRKEITLNVKKECHYEPNVFGNPMYD